MADHWRKTSQEPYEGQRVMVKTRRRGVYEYERAVYSEGEYWRGGYGKGKPIYKIQGWLPEPEPVTLPASNPEVWLSA